MSSVNLLTILILTALASPTPAPAATPTPDPCGKDGHTAVLSAINRPTVGFSPCAIKPHEFLGEFGVQPERGTSDFVQIGQGFMRFGEAPNVEVDVIGPAYQTQSAPVHASGFADSGVGMKWEFAHSQSSAFGMDVLLTAPTGAAAFTAGVPTQTVNVDYSTSFGKFGVASTIGALHTNAYSSLLPSVVVSNQWTDNAQWYAEAFAQTKTSANTGALLGFDGGVQYMIAPQLELDVEAGRTISDVARERYVGVGVGVRL